MIRVVLAVWMIVGVQLGAAPASRAAETMPAQAVVDQTAAEEFEAWRRTIPDYERRLYNRVKDLNRRVNQLATLAVAGFGLLLVLVPAAAWWSAGRRSPGAAPAAAGPRLGFWILRGRQRRLERSLNQMESLVARYVDDIEACRRDGDAVAEVLKDCRRLAGDLERELAGAGRDLGR